MIVAYRQSQRDGAPQSACRSQCSSKTLKVLEILSCLVAPRSDFAQTEPPRQCLPGRCLSRWELAEGNDNDENEEGAY